MTDDEDAQKKQCNEAGICSVRQHAIKRQCREQFAMEGCSMKPMVWILLWAVLPVLSGQALSSSDGKHTNKQPHVCGEAQKLLSAWRGGRAPKSVPKDFVVGYQLTDGGDTSYRDIDIDGDGINDQIVRSCGASLNALCLLSVDLSAGERLELELGRFFLASVKSSIYVIVGDTSKPEASKRGKRQVYRITKQKIKLICPHI